MSNVFQTVAILVCIIRVSAAARSTVVKASEYDDYLKLVQLKMDQVLCLKREQTRLPAQTIYTKYPADCRNSHIPFYLLMLQMMRRERKLGALEQVENDDLHQEVLHYLNAKNAQLLESILFDRSVRNIEDIKKFYMYLGEFYGAALIEKIYERVIDTYLGPKPGADDGLLVDHLRLIYRIDNELSFKLMVQALVYLYRKTSRSGNSLHWQIQHLRDTLRDISHDDFYYQLDDDLKNRIDRITAIGDHRSKSARNGAVDYWSNLVVLKWHAASMSIIGSIEAMNETYRYLLQDEDLEVQTIFESAIDDIWRYIDFAWIPGYLEMVFREGSPESFKMMVYLQMYANEVFQAQGFDNNLYMMHFVYQLSEEIYENVYFNQLKKDLEVKLDAGRDFMNKRFPDGLFIWNYYCLIDKATDTILRAKDGAYIWHSDFRENVHPDYFQLDFKISLESSRPKAGYLNSTFGLQEKDSSSTSVFSVDFVGENEVILSQAGHKFCHCSYSESKNGICSLKDAPFRHEPIRCRWIIKSYRYCEKIISPRPWET